MLYLLREVNLQGGFFYFCFIVINWIVSYTLESAKKRYALCKCYCNVSYES